LKGIRRGLTEKQAATDPNATDPRLRGRTYAIPFENVWQASISLSGGGMRGWSIASADDQSGVIVAVVRSAIFGLEDDVRIEVGLDEDAQTRVDLQAVSRGERGDLGRTRRVVDRFIRRLDRRLDATPGQILDPTRPPAWHGDA